MNRHMDFQMLINLFEQYVYIIGLFNYFFIDNFLYFKQSIDFVQMAALLKSDSPYIHKVKLIANNG